MVKMIITDLDDTLLRSDKTISDYTVYIPVSYTHLREYSK